MGDDLAILQPGVERARVDEQEQQSCDADAHCSPATGRLRYPALCPTGRSEHALVLMTSPIAHSFDCGAATLHRILPKRTLMADIVVNDPFAPERSHRICIQREATPTFMLEERCRRRGIELDPARVREKDFHPGMRAAGP